MERETGNLNERLRSIVSGEIGMMSRNVGDLLGVFLESSQGGADEDSGPGWWGAETVEKGVLEGLMVDGKWAGQCDSALRPCRLWARLL